MSVSEGQGRVQGEESGCPRWSSEALGGMLGPKQLPFPPRPSRGLYLDTEAEVGGHPIELAALGHHIHVGLVHICYILQVPRILGSMGRRDLLQAAPVPLTAVPVSQLGRFLRGAEKCPRPHSKQENQDSNSVFTCLSHYYLLG